MKGSALKNQVRIIGGQWKRRMLSFPDSEGLRPTPDRVRETLFNWLGQDLRGWRCLDAFAGHGLDIGSVENGSAAVLSPFHDRVGERMLASSLNGSDKAQQLLLVEI